MTLTEQLYFFSPWGEATEFAKNLQELATGLFQAVKSRKHWLSNYFYF